MGINLNNSGLDNTLYELERHIHNTPQAFGNSSNNLSRGALSVFTVSSGNNAYSTELQIHDGTVIESGSTSKFFDLHRLFINAVGTKDVPIFFEFYYGTQGTGVSCTFTNATEKVNAVAHGLLDGTKIMFSSDDTLPTGLNNYIVYYIVNKADDDFQVSLTLGGSTVTISNDGTGNHLFHIVTQTLLTESYISKAAVTVDAIPLITMSRRIYCNNRIWIRAKSLGATNSFSFFLELHTYDR